MIHNADPVETCLFRSLGYLAQPRPQRRRPTVPGEIRDMQTNPHPRTLLTIGRSE
jgi:hypothetical protein